jgi:hypothetical protein
MIIHTISFHSPLHFGIAASAMGRLLKILTWRDLTDEERSCLFGRRKSKAFIGAEKVFPGLTQNGMPPALTSLAAPHNSRGRPLVGPKRDLIDCGLPLSHQPKFAIVLSVSERLQATFLFDNNHHRRTNGVVDRESPATHTHART